MKKLKTIESQTVKMKFDSRKLMELAVEVMRQSVPEPRKDGKLSPLVGAVIFKPDGTVETACRGELRYGDHAEFTLLERKNRPRKLDGCKLFTTLEPCAPGARSFPKLSCAERVYLARIKEVWIGIEDPDPKVDRKGIKYLEENGVTFHMFDRDLQDIIKEINREPIAQALERAEAEKLPKKIVLSQFEDSFPAVEIKDFSIESLEDYRLRANIRDEVGSSSFYRRLLQQGFLKETDGHLVPTGFGLLLFGKEPRITIPQAGLLGTIHNPDGTEGTRDFDGPMVQIPSLVQKWLEDKLPSAIDRSQMQRKQKPAFPFEMIREAVVNALIHRDYDIREAKCQLIVTPDTVIVKSPGAPLPPITLEQLQSFNAPMLSRNPVLHYVFARMELAEERGLGLNSLRSQAQKEGLPLPRYSFEDPYLVLTMYRNAVAPLAEFDQTILRKLKADDKKTLEYITLKESVSSIDLRNDLGYDERKAQRMLKKLVEIGLLHRVGKGPSTRYEVKK
jgi:ATP-dependent DNA helicase RecG